MNDSTHVVPRPRRASAPRARTVAAIAAIAAIATVALAAVAYGGSTPNAWPSSLSRTTSTQKALAYSRCMRAHGARFPDPSSSGVIPKVSLRQLGVSSSDFQAAERACQNLLPAGTDDQYPPGEVQQLLIGMLRFSQCMRSHGVPNWPDPTTDSEGRPIFPLPAAGISRQQAKSPQVTDAGDDCQHLLPAALPNIPIGGS